MRFTGEEYYRAALERMRQAKLVHEAGRSYALAMYTAGLAVECLLRAFRWEHDPSFEGRHDLAELLKASSLLRINEEYLRRKGRKEEEIEAETVSLQGAMSEVAILWHNNLRFASEGSLKAYLIRIDRVRGIRGDVLKKNSTDLLDAAQTVIERGVTIWTSKRK